MAEPSSWADVGALILGIVVFGWNFVQHFQLVNISRRGAQCDVMLADLVSYVDKPIVEGLEQINSLVADFIRAVPLSGLELESAVNNLQDHLLSRLMVAADRVGEADDYLETLAMIRPTKKFEQLLWYLRADAAGTALDDEFVNCIQQFSANGTPDIRREAVRKLASEIRRRKVHLHATQTKLRRKVIKSFDKS